MKTLRRENRASGSTRRKADAIAASWKRQDKARRRVYALPKTNGRASA